MNLLLGSRKRKVSRKARGFSVLHLQGEIYRALLRPNPVNPPIVWQDLRKILLKYFEHRPLNPPKQPTSLANRIKTGHFLVSG
ncbi:hypothetical protein M5K25_026377 [Dendrobium thyrsiflorum]|uniref:Uncharacterized protein n=1 Tax=Dendrobium thyrsiflorum TaxID=117978 RepID=A0ABD0TXG0_DENTH